MLALQQVVGGLATGGIYATMALALVITHRATGMINFAQGQMAVLSTYFAWSLIQAGCAVPLAVIGAVVLSVPMGAMVERLVIRRIAHLQPLVGIVVTIGLLILLNGITGLIWGYEIQPFPSMFPAGIMVFAGLRVSRDTIGILGVLVVLVLALHLLFSRTHIGLAMRAVADNPASSALSGLHVNRLLMQAWGLSTAIGAVAGCLVAPKIYLEPDMMQQILIYALIAAVIGGLDSPLGVILASEAVGVVENLAATYIGFIGNDLQIALPLLLMGVVLLVRPQGLFGRALKIRV